MMTNKEKAKHLSWSRFKLWRVQMAQRFWSFTEDPKDPPPWAREFVIAQCDNGDFWLPSHERALWWDRPFKPLNPFHWPAALLSRATGWVTFIEGN